MDIDIVVVPVREWNSRVKPDSNFYRNTFKNIYTGEDKKTGYVASYKDCHFWAKTKKEAYNNCLADYRKWA